MKTNILRNRFVVILFVILSFMLMAKLISPSDVQAADKVLLRLSWSAGSEHTAFIVAMDKGFYKEEGIDITIKEGTGGTMSLKLVGAGGGETFGITGTNVAVKGVAQGVPVIQIMTIETSKQEGILSRPEAGIKEPKDLIGKKIGGTGAGTSDIFDAFLAANNIPPDKLTFVNVGQGRDQALVTGKIDAGLGIGMNLIPVLKKLGLKSP